MKKERRKEYGVKVYLDQNEWKIDEKQTNKLREKVDHPADIMWDFGEHREAYEKVWTDEASGELAVRYRVLTQLMNVRIISMQFINISVIEMSR
nr:hypothetical protein [Bacillus pumilus]